jgi:hypothetical protein
MDKIKLSHIKVCLAAKVLEDRQSEQQLLADNILNAKIKLHQ